MKIHHIGYLVKSIEESMELFGKIGYTMESKMQYDKIRDVTICFMTNDTYRVELVSPVSEQSVVYKQMKKSGNTPYHICYEVEALEDSIANLRKEKYIVVKNPECACAIQNKRVAFLHHRHMGLIELVEV